MFSKRVWFITSEHTIDFTTAISHSHLAKLLKLPNTSTDINTVATYL